MPYIGTSPSNGVRRVHTYTATASQTTFTGASSEGVTLSYADTNYIDVFQNGVLLGSADYTSTSGTSVVLAQGASADDLIVIVVYDVFSVADTVSKTNGGTFDGAIGIGTSSVANNRSLHVSSTAQKHARFERTGSATSQIEFSDSTTTNQPSLGSVGDNLTFETANTERARVDSSGTVNINTTVQQLTANEKLRVVGKSSFTVSGDSALNVNRDTDNGALARFYRGGTLVGSISSLSSERIAIHTGTVGIEFNPSNQINPSNGSGAVDNTLDLGASGARFDDIFATNGTIQTSDRNEKQDIEELSDAEKRVAVVAKGLMRKFRWKDAVAEKGDNARTHFGIIAQDLQDAFTAEGLDAGDYAMFISDTWWEKEISVDAVEADEENGIEAKDAYTYMDIKEEATEGYTEKTRLGVRYSELLAFIISAI